MAERIKGQETVVRIIRNGVVETELTDIQNMEITWDLELLDEGYLGETTNRKDDVFRGMSGRMTLHMEGDGPFEFVNALVNRARRKVPMFSVDILTVLKFPGGSSPKINLPDCRFGGVPMGFQERGEYVTIDLEFACSEYQIIS